MMPRRNLLLLVLLMTVACADREQPATTTQAAPDASNVEVTLSESELQLSSELMRPGSTQFTILNQGHYPHGIVVRGNGFEQVIQAVEPGTQTVFTIELEPGTYVVLCPHDDARGNHARSGERAELIVRE